MTRDPRKRDGRVVTLRNEIDGPDSRHLWAHLDQEGNLHIDGQDLGPKTAIVSSDGEYEWFETIDRSDLPKLIGLLGGKPEDDIPRCSRRELDRTAGCRSRGPTT